jgi:putative membrane protein
VNLLVRILVTAVALWLTSLILPDRLEILGGDGSVGSRVLAVLIVAVVYSLVSAIVKPIVSMLSLPLLILTLGLFYLVINAFMLWLTTWLTSQAFFGEWGLQVHGGFWWYVWIGLIVAVLQLVIGALAPKKRD